MELFRQYSKYSNLASKLVGTLGLQAICLYIYIHVKLLPQPVKKKKLLLQVQLRVGLGFFKKESDSDKKIMVRRTSRVANNFIMGGPFSFESKEKN